MAWSDKKRGLQAATEDIRWSYEQVSGFWTGVEIESDSSEDGSIDEGIKDQKNIDYQ